MASDTDFGSYNLMPGVRILFFPPQNVEPVFN